MTLSTITLFEEGHPLSYTFDDLQKLHGFNAPAGIAMAIKVMEKVLPLLSEDGYVERRELSFETCFKGIGFKDSIEMMTRAVSEGRYTIDEELKKPHAHKGFRGGYVYRVSYRGKTVEVILRDGLMWHEFFRLLAEEEKSNDDLLRIAELKSNMTAGLLALDGRWVYRTLEEDLAETR